MNSQHEKSDVNNSEMKSELKCEGYKQPETRHAQNGQIIDMHRGKKMLRAGE